MKEMAVTAGHWQAAQRHLGWPLRAARPEVR